MINYADNEDSKKERKLAENRVLKAANIFGLALVDMVRSGELKDLFDVYSVLRTLVDTTESAIVSKHGVAVFAIAKLIIDDQHKPLLNPHDETADPLETLWNLPEKEEKKGSDA